MLVMLRTALESCCSMAKVSAFRLLLARAHVTRCIYYMYKVEAFDVFFICLNVVTYVIKAIVAV